MLDKLRKLAFIFKGRVLTLPAIGPVRGRVLLSYITLPFFSGDDDAHTNRFECREIARIWREAGYEVDAIEHYNENFIPKESYDICIDIGNAFERYGEALGDKCLKIFHITGAYWRFQNEAEEKRIRDIRDRRGIDLKARRQVPPSKNIELCDLATMIGNDFTESTYAFAGKPIYRIPISTTHLYPSPESKDFVKSKRSYIWIGGSGMAHKGLDLVLEAFAQMPEYDLVVFGKKDPDFAEAYKKELFETPSIRYAGVVNLGSKEFASTADESVGMVFPSCSEGSSGGVVTAMHAGLIPLISYQSGVDVDGFGTVFKENTVDEIKRQIASLSSLPTSSLRDRSIAAWKYARGHHTRETFTKAYSRFVSDMIKRSELSRI